jgi:hypothetical protein
MPKFHELSVLKDTLVNQSADAFFDNFVRTPDEDALSAAGVSFIQERILLRYRINVAEDDMIVVGSSKLGYALHEKRTPSGLLPAFRGYGDDSDLDIAICSSDLFEALWHELSSYLCSKPTMPYAINKCGDYLQYGWLRPDQLVQHFSGGLTKISQLRDLRGDIRKDKERGHPKADIGLFHSVDHLKLYQTRSLQSCKLRLESPL